MNKNNILKNYITTAISPWWSIYINIKIIREVIQDLYQNWFKILWYELIRIHSKWTQPFMEYSIWNELWYTENEVYKELEKLNKKLIKTNFLTEEVFFDILVNSQNDT